MKDRINFGVFDHVFVLRGTYKEACSQMEEITGESLEFRIEQESLGFTCLDDKLNIYVWVSNELKLKMRAATIAHEAVHIVEHLYKRSGVMANLTCPGCAEQTAMLVEHAFTIMAQMYMPKR